MKRIELTETLPFNQEDDGTIRLSGSRVTVDTLIGAFKNGNTAEQLHDSFPSLSHVQIYSAIAWYLNHPAEAEEYLHQRATEAERLRQEIEGRDNYAALREKIQRRREELIKSSPLNEITNAQR